MKVARSVAEVLAGHTTLTLECIDRMYLNVYVPLLQRAAGAAYFFREMRGAAIPSSALMGPMTRRFVSAIKRFAERNGIEIVSFRRGERKDERKGAKPGERDVRSVGPGGKSSISNRPLSVLTVWNMKSFGCCTITVTTASRRGAFVTRSRTLPRRLAGGTRAMRN